MNKLIATLLIGLIFSINLLVYSQYQAVKNIKSLNTQLKKSNSTKENNKSVSNLNTTGMLHFNFKVKNQQMIMYATAWAADANTLVTAAHFCIAISNEVGLTKLNSNKEVVNTGGGRPVVIDLHTDICIINMPGHGIVPLKLSNDKVNIGDYTQIIGAPNALWPVSSEGHVVNTAVQIDNSYKLMISNVCNHGSSGGPIINYKGEVVGVVLGMSQGATYGVSIDKVKLALDSLKDENNSK